MPAHDPLIVDQRLEEIGDAESECCKGKDRRAVKQSEGADGKRRQRISRQNALAANEEMGGISFCFRPEEKPAKALGEEHTCISERNIRMRLRIEPGIAHEKPCARTLQRGFQL